MMRGGKRENAGRVIKGWSDVFKGMGSELRRYPKPLVEKLDGLREQGAHILDVIRALENVPIQNAEDFSSLRVRNKVNYLFAFFLH
jgi:hypothetical protein